MENSNDIQNEMLIPIIMTKCENVTNSIVILKYFKLLTKFLNIFNAQDETLLPILEWSLSLLNISIISDQKILKHIISTVGAFFNYFGDALLQCFDEIVQCFNNLISEANEQIIIYIIDAISFAAAQLSDHAETKDAFVNFCQVAFELRNNVNDNEYFLELIDQAISRFTICCGPLLFDILSSFTPYLLEQTQEEIDYVSFPIDANIQEVPGHYFSMEVFSQDQDGIDHCSDVIFINKSSEYKVYSAFYLLRFIINSAGIGTISDIDALISIITERISSDILYLKVSMVCWQLLESLLTKDPTKEHAARLIVSLIQNSKISYLSKLINRKAFYDSERNIRSVSNEIQNAYIFALQIIKDNQYNEIENVTESLSELFTVIELNLGDQIDDDDPSSFDIQDIIYSNTSNIKEITKIVEIAFEIFTQEMLSIYSERCLPFINQFISKTNGLFFVFKTFPLFLAASQDMASFPQFSEIIIQFLSSQNPSKIQIALSSLETICDTIALDDGAVSLFIEKISSLFDQSNAVFDDCDDFLDLARIVLTKFTQKYEENMDKQTILSNWFNFAQPTIKGQENKIIFDFFIHLMTDEFSIIAEIFGPDKILAYIIYNLHLEYVQGEREQKFKYFLQHFPIPIDEIIPSLNEQIQAMYSQIIEQNSH